MQQKFRNKRIILDEINCEEVAKKLELLTELNCKLSASDFINFCIEQYLKRSFDKDQELFENKFFDRKKYLKKLMQEDNFEEFKDSLKALNSKIKVQSTKRTSPSGKSL